VRMRPAHWLWSVPRTNVIYVILLRIWGKYLL
jgi:hypothetical protein